MKILKLSLAILVLTLTACASTGDIENIQSQVDTLKVSVAQISTDARNAQVSVADAAAKATIAQIATEKAAKLSKEASAKLDYLFKKIVSK
jgi:murein lipoprotein